MWILIIAAAITILWYAFGNSPPFELGLLFFLLGIYFQLNNTVYELKSDFKHFKSSCIESFNQIKRDMEVLKKK